LNSQTIVFSLWELIARENNYHLIGQDTWEFKGVPPFRLKRQGQSPAFLVYPVCYAAGCYVRLLHPDY
jgi:hypothetical protein